VVMVTARGIPWEEVGVATGSLMPRERGRAAMAVRAIWRTGAARCRGRESPSYSRTRFSRGSSRLAVRTIQDIKGAAGEPLCSASVTFFLLMFCNHHHHPRKIFLAIQNTRQIPRPLQSTYGKVTLGHTHNHSGDRTNCLGIRLLVSHPEGYNQCKQPLLNQALFKRTSLAASWMVFFSSSSLSFVVLSSSCSICNLKKK
jgi:hypothetical protein